MDTHLWSEHQTAVVVGAVAFLVLVLLGVAWAIRRKASKKPDAQLAADLAQGKFETAAERELKAGRMNMAYNLFLRAQKPARAAQIAVRMGRLQDAAELFAKTGYRKRAADLYQKAGMKQKADELLAEEEQAAREREEEQAALRKHVEEEPEEDIASLDRSLPSARLASTPAPTPTAPSPPGLGTAPKPETPSLFGIQAMVGEATRKAASEALALAATQASIPSPGAPPRTTDPVQLGTLSMAGMAAPPANPKPVGDQVKPAAPELSFDEARPALQELSFGEEKTEAEPSSSGGAAPVQEHLLIDSHPPGSAPSTPPAAVVEQAPGMVPRPARITPRTPIPVVSPSIGAYRMVRPSEPDVYTPPPSVRRASGEYPSGEQRPRTPTPSPRLSLGTKLGVGQAGPLRARTPAPELRPAPAGTRPATPPPAPHTSPEGMVLGLGPQRPGK